jgi:hypothetical protein
MGIVGLERAAESRARMFVGVVVAVGLERRESGESGVVVEEDGVGVGK